MCRRKSLWEKHFYIILLHWAVLKVILILASCRDSNNSNLLFDIHTAYRGILLNCLLIFEGIISFVAVKLTFLLHSYNNNSHVLVFSDRDKFLKRLKSTRYYSFMYVSVMKIICMFLTMLGIYYFENNQIASLFNNFQASFNQRDIYITEVSISILCKTCENINNQIQ